MKIPPCQHTRIQHYGDYAIPFDRCRDCKMRRYYRHPPTSPYRNQIVTGDGVVIDVTSHSGSLVPGAWVDQKFHVEGQRRLKARPALGDWY